MINHIDLDVVSISDASLIDPSALAAVARNVAAQCFDVVNAPWANSHKARVLAATTIKQLSYSHSSSVISMLLHQALNYWNIQREIGDASPYSPNAVEMLGDAPPSSEIHELLLDLVQKGGSMADGDAYAALSRISARLFCSERELELR
jgi:hypothetical protein